MRSTSACEWTVTRDVTSLLSFFFNDTATSEIYTLSLHDALPISPVRSAGSQPAARWRSTTATPPARSEEHTSELQSRSALVCRLLLEKKNKRVPLLRLDGHNDDSALRLRG